MIANEKLRRRALLVAASEEVSFAATTSWPESEIPMQQKLYESRLAISLWVREKAKKRRHRLQLREPAPVGPAPREFLLPETSARRAFAENYRPFLLILCRAVRAEGVRR